jgi:osmotically-inducible protein OsmY
MVKREDERIRADVSERLSTELPDDAAQMQVDVMHGEVTLAGTVDTPEAWHQAERAAESIVGVVSVMNDLRVRPAGLDRCCRMGGTGAAG